MRKTKIVPITAEGRDKGKMFLLREMSASQAERWAVRAFLALSRSGFDVPPSVVSSGFAGLAAFGIRAIAGASYADAEPLLAEMFSCIDALPDPARPSIQRALVEDDIEEVATRVFLRGELIELHTGFSIAAALSKQLAAAKTTDDDTSAIPTSPSPSQP